MKARNREINIFNMSLLDILCGALGAFCFMMLSLLPYYRVSNDNIEINKEQKKLLDSVQDIKDLAERLKSASTAEDLSELVKQLQEKILAMENDIKRLQGTVNSLLGENAELKKKIESLEQEKQQLVAANQKLEQENQKLVAENQDLRAKLQQSEAERQKLAQENQKLSEENKRLNNENEQLQRAVRQKLPWVITTMAADPSQAISCSLHETRIKTRDGQMQPDFDPNQPRQPIWVFGDFAFTSGGSYVHVSAERAINSVRKLYVNLANPAAGRKGTEARGTATGQSLDDIRIAPFKLTPERPWIFVGTFTVPELNKVVFVPATDAEREAEWNRLMDPKKPPPPPPPPPPPVPETKDPNKPMSRTEAIAEARRQAEAAEAAAKRGGVDPAMQGRLRNLVKAVAEAMTDEEKNLLYEKALKEAATEEERDRIRSIRTGRPPAGPAGPPVRERK